MLNSPAALKALTTLAKHQTQPKPATEPFYFEYFSPSPVQCLKMGAPFPGACRLVGTTLVPADKGYRCRYLSFRSKTYCPRVAWLLIVPVPCKTNQNPSVKGSYLKSRRKPGYGSTRRCLQKADQSYRHSLAPSFLS